MIKSRAGPARRQWRRGMILGIVVLTLFMLGIFLFAYQRVAMQQNAKAHREQIAEVAATLAITGVNLLAEQIGSGFDTLIDQAAPALKTQVMSGNPAPPVVIDSSDRGGSLLRTVRDDFDDFLRQLDKFPQRPSCRSMELSFADIRQITPGTDNVQMQAGRDPVEKLGEAVIACSVEYQGLVRKAMIRRQFRVVSMVPGPFARFTLFAPFTPSYNSFNSLGVKYNGQADDSYKHPFPSGANHHFAAPLKLFNGTDTLSPGRIADARTDLQTRGWVFIGPAHDTTDFEDPVLLKIPSGYHASAGGNFMLALPPATNGGREVVPPEIVNDAARYQLPHPVATLTCAIGQVWQGFYTYENGNADGAAGANLWPHLTAGWPCAASWLFPFGDRQQPSRTLLIGPVLAGFLQFSYLKDATFGGPAWKLVIKGQSPTEYRADNHVANALGATPPQSPTHRDLFLASPDDPSGMTGYTNARAVMPRDFTPNESAFNPWSGTPFNLFFDFMEYPGSGSPYPDATGGGRVLKRVNNAFYVPRYDVLDDVDVVGLPGLHPYDAVPIRFTDRDGAVPLDNLYFNGNLTRFSIANNNLLARVTHIIDLSFCRTQAEEDACFAGHLFHLTTADRDAAHANWWKPQKKGIFFVRRRAGVQSGGDRLSLPTGNGIFLDQNIIIIVDRGDLRIARRIISDRTDGAPTKLCSLVALEGNVIVGTAEEIDAYLVALNPGPNRGGGGGRLLVDHVGKSIDIFGGLAVWEIGLYAYSNTATTMGTCLNGGSIRYNPRFNASTAAYAASRELIIEDNASSLQVVGGL